MCYTAGVNKMAVSKLCKEGLKPVSQFGSYQPHALPCHWTWTSIMQETEESDTWITSIPPSPKRAKMSIVSPRLLVLVRHGDYKTWSELPEQKGLTPQGKQQARSTAKALKNMPGRPKVHRVVTHQCQEQWRLLELFTVTFKTTISQKIPYS